MNKRVRLNRDSGKVRENRLKLLNTLKLQLYSFSNLELKIILTINKQEIPCEDKDCLIKMILTYIPSLDIKRTVDNFSKIKVLLESLISLSETEFDILTAIYKINDTLDKEEKIIQIFKIRPLNKLEKDLITFGKIRLLIVRLEELSDYEFEILFKDSNHNIKNVFKNYSYESINHELSKLNQIQNYITEFNKLSETDINYLIDIKGLNTSGSKEDKIKSILSKCAFSEIHAMLYEYNKIKVVRSRLEELSDFELNMLLLLNGKSLAFTNQSIKIFKELPINLIKRDIVRVKHLKQIQFSEFLTIQEGLKKSSFKDLAQFIGEPSTNNFNLKDLFEKAYKIILLKYELIEDLVEKEENNLNDQSDLDLFL